MRIADRAREPALPARGGARRQGFPAFRGNPACHRRSNSSSGFTVETRLVWRRRNRPSPRQSFVFSGASSSLARPPRPLVLVQREHVVEAGRRFRSPIARQAHGINPSPLPSLLRCGRLVIVRVAPALTWPLTSILQAPRAGDHRSSADASVAEPTHTGAAGAGQANHATVVPTASGRS
jgi:hypothetical protein